MTFFAWMPEDSAPRTSPWLALYGGLTVVLTLGVIFGFKKWSTIEEDARRSVKEDMAKDMEAHLFSRFTFRSSSSSDGSSDLEKGV